VIIRLDAGPTGRLGPALQSFVTGLRAGFR
jgi:hypothetical protein